MSELKRSTSNSYVEICNTQKKTMTPLNIPTISSQKMVQPSQPHQMSLQASTTLQPSITQQMMEQGPPPQIEESSAAHQLREQRPPSRNQMRLQPSSINQQSWQHQMMSQFLPSHEEIEDMFKNQRNAVLLNKQRVDYEQILVKFDLYSLKIQEIQYFLRRKINFNNQQFNQCGDIAKDILQQKNNEEVMVHEGDISLREVCLLYI